MGELIEVLGKPRLAKLAQNPPKEDVIFHRHPHTWEWRRSAIEDAGADICIQGYAAGGAL